MKHQMTFIRLPQLEVKVNDVSCEAEFDDCHDLNEDRPLQMASIVEQPINVEEKVQENPNSQEEEKELPKGGNSDENSEKSEKVDVVYQNI